MKKWYLAALCCVVLLSGCSIQKDDDKKLRDVDFTVMEERTIPQELKSQIDEMKETSFEITYGDEGYLYIAKGYGTKETSGYSIEVETCYETTNTICLETNLLGPPKDEKILDKETFPYIVIKIEYSDKHVVFS